MSDDHRDLVGQFWETLARRDFEGVGAFMAPSGHYVDVPVKGIEPGAYGPAETAARLRLGIEPLQGYELHGGRIVASDGFVITEHAETWTWDDEHSVRLPFASVQEWSDGQCQRWWDYFDFSALMNAAPPWWVEHISAGYK